MRKLILIMFEFFVAFSNLVLGFAMIFSGTVFETGDAWIASIPFLGGTLLMAEWMERTQSSTPKKSKKSLI